MLKQHTYRRRSGKTRVGLQHSSGFTLVEMLVAVTLILVMMTLFAEVFQIASSSMSKTRGIAENDQRSRTLQTIIKADLDKRTMRWVYPFAASEDTGAQESNIGKRQGFLYYSENNPFNDLDDVLHFTVMSTLTMRNKDTSPYYGRALYLPRPSNVPNPPPYKYNAADTQEQFFGYNNQPDADDAQLNPNNTGLSTVAEVVYFVRNGNLYRRQLLIREPLAVVGSNKSEPTDNNGQPIFNSTTAEVQYPVSFFAPDPTNNNKYPTTFWADFDYSAVFSSSGAKFLGTNCLDNSTTDPIAKPHNRFGFSPFVLGVGLRGRPKEFFKNIPTDDHSNFIGRFTMAECTDISFGYPMTKSTGGYIPTDPSVPLTPDPNDNTVSEFNQGIRRGEDLMLANVHAFDVQIWDEGVRRFVNVGDSTLPNSADYARSNRLNFSYGPRLLTPTSSPPESPPTVVNSVFDTWHPHVDNDAPPGDDNPPFRPVYQVPDSVLGAATPSNEWQPNTSYGLGKIVFPSGPPGTTFPSPPYAANKSKKLPYGYPFFYRCIYAGTSGGTNDTTPTSTDYRFEPNWPRADGLTVVDGGVIWQAVDNRKPLRAIRIQIRFLDTATQQLRQLTILHSLVD